MKKHIKKLDCLVLLSKDLKKTEAFYRVLGFDIEKADTGVVIARLEEFYLHFHTEAEFKISFRDSLATELVGRGILIYIEVDDAQAYYEGLKRSDIQNVSEPRKMPWGNIEFGLQDPDGYNLCFYQLIT